MKRFLAASAAALVLALSPRTAYGIPDSLAALDTRTEAHYAWQAKDIPTALHRQLLEDNSGAIGSTRHARKLGGRLVLDSAMCALAQRYAAEQSRQEQAGGLEISVPEDMTEFSPCIGVGYSAKDTPTDIATTVRSIVAGLVESPDTQEALFSQTRKKEIHIGIGIGLSQQGDAVLGERVIVLIFMETP